MNTSTIAAIATPGGQGGIGIVKISGPKALSIASTLFSPLESVSASAAGNSQSAKGESLADFQSHRLLYGHIINPVNRRVLDEVLVCIMKSPRSYTKEDVVEINAHGGQVVVNAILELVLGQGAQLAEPGEFTKRAFLNGRIDLTQAEAVIDVINARTEKALQVAAAQIEGKLKNSVELIRESLFELLARMEAVIDFPEEVAEIIDPVTTCQKIESCVVEPLGDLIRHYAEGNVLRDGLKVAVVGRPNVGKSSLMNCLLKKERAIVTSVPGTTRDAIEESLNINGFHIVLTDTAGLHETNDLIENIGIEKTIKNIQESDLILFMVEANHELGTDDYKIFEQIQPKPRIIVMNKIDLINGRHPVEFPDAWKENDIVKISALYNQGIVGLKDQIIKIAFNNNPIEIESCIVPNLRQKILLEDSLEAAASICCKLKDGIPMELIAIDLKDAIDSLDQILGSSVKMDVLDHIFSRFCIGK
jgi:tRNA modification GTPase